jgi:hypothetical protein
VPGAGGSVVDVVLVEVVVVMRTVLVDVVDVEVDVEVELLVLGDRRAPEAGFVARKAASTTAAATTRRFPMHMTPRGDRHDGHHA